MKTKKESTITAFGGNRTPV